jgi:hypothetical protein
VEQEERSGQWRSRVGGDKWKSAMEKMELEERSGRVKWRLKLEELNE